MVWTSGGVADGKIYSERGVITMAAYTVPNYGGNFQMPNQMQNVQNYQPSIIQQSNNGYICRPVTGREEAVAMQVDFLGPGTLMPDFPHGIIYFKRFNPNTGAADFAEFRLAPPQPEPKPAQGVTMDDFNALADRVRKLEKMEGGIKNDANEPHDVSDAGR
nr:MAG TPA: hypothetical protein [Caudoviricetes sp.]